MWAMHTSPSKLLLQSSDICIQNVAKTLVVYKLRGQSEAAFTNQQVQPKTLVSAELLIF